MEDNELFAKLKEQIASIHVSLGIHADNCPQSLNSCLTPQRAAAWCDTLRSVVVNPSLGNAECRVLSQSCLLLMRTFQDEVCVQKSGLLAIAVLCEKRKLAEGVGLEGFIPLLTSTWKNFSQDGLLVRHAIITMRSLSDVERNRELFCEMGGMEILSGSMETFPHDMSIQVASTALLANLCYESIERKRDAVECGLVEIISNVLRNFKGLDCERLLLNACLALRNISVEELALSAILTNKERLNAILSTVSWSQKHPSVGQEALGIVLNLVTNVALSHPMISTLNVIAAEVISFLQQTLSGTSEQDFNHELCFAIMGRILVHRTNILDNHKRDFLLVASLYGAKYVSCFSSISKSIVTGACSCIRDVIKESRSRQYFTTVPGGIEMLVDAASYLSEQPLQVEQALMALGNAVFDSQHGKRRAQEHGGIQIVHRILLQKIYLENVVEACLTATHAICSMDVRNGDIASEEMMHASCARAMRTLSNNAVIQERGLVAIVSLASSQNAVKRLSKSSVLEVAQEALTSFPYSRVIRAQEMKIRSLTSSLPASVQKGCTDLQLRSQKSFWRHFSR